FSKQYDNVTRTHGTTLTDLKSTLFSLGLSHDHTLLAWGTTTADIAFVRSVIQGQTGPVADKIEANHAINVQNLCRKMLPAAYGSQVDANVQLENIHQLLIPDSRDLTYHDARNDTLALHEIIQNMVIAADY
ncbi:hypothetical protein H2200_013490, partial [Cladophialophora chaetospira]